MRAAPVVAIALGFVACTERERPDLAYVPRPEPRSDDGVILPVPSREPAPVDPLIADVAERLAGVWRSVEYPDSSMTITVNSAWVTNNTGKYPAIEARTYKLYTRLNPPSGVPAHRLEPGKAYIDLKMSSGNIQYEVGHIGEDTLELIHFFFSGGERYKSYNHTRVK